MPNNTFLTENAPNCFTWMLTAAILGSGVPLMATPMTDTARLPTAFIFKLRAAAAVAMVMIMMMV